jgi:glycosyl-4,4'-diaponeurosporenoate acyltransferase
VIVKLIAINALSWLIVQLSIAAIFLRVPAGLFSHNSRLFQIHPRELNLYRNMLHIRRWKHLLPNGASWLGGTSCKESRVSRDPHLMHRFVIETRRSEAAHWLMLACCPIFFLWNPPRAWPILALYAAAANLPCIAAQRYNRQTAQRILGRTTL